MWWRATWCHKPGVTSKCSGITIMTSWVGTEKMQSFALVENCHSSQNVNIYTNKVWDKKIKRILPLALYVCVLRLNSCNLYLIMSYWHRLWNVHCTEVTPISLNLLVQFWIMEIVNISSNNGPLVRYIKLQVAHAPGMPGTFSPPSRESDPGKHHGTCVTHVPWCMLGSITSGFLWGRWRGKLSRHSRRMRSIPQFYVSGKRPMACHCH